MRLPRRLLPSLLLGLVFMPRGHALWTDRFEGDVLQACWGLDVPSPAKARVTFDADHDLLRVTALGDTNMWGTRADAPIIWLPTSGGSFVIETHVAGKITDDRFVAGLTVYGDGKGNDDGEHPNFSFGLDHWNGANRMVKLQGLGNNRPAINVAAPEGQAWLRLEYMAPAEGNDGPGTYRALYKLTQDDAWTELSSLTRNIPRARAGLFLKTAAPRSVAFSYAAFEDFRRDGAFDPDAVAAYHEKRRRAAAAERRRQLIAQSKGDLNALREAIAQARAGTAGSFPQADAYLARLARIEQALAAGGDAAASQLGELRREAMTTQPVVSRHPICFVVRRQYRRDHHNTATMFQTGEINTGSFTGGGALKSIDLARQGAVTTILGASEGVIRDPDVHFDGTKILFSMRRSKTDDYHIYEINTDGAELTQLTFGAGIADFDPAYLPDGRIIFSSTREPKFCMCNRHIMGNLFRMDADGGNIHQIGHSTLHEGHGALMPDGRILYDRWEYVDRNFGDAQGLWTTNPDGTAHLVYFGNNTPSPGGIIDARVLPDGHRFIATFTSCHDRPWGAIALVDRRLGLDGRKPVLRTWPESAINLVMKGNYDTFIKVKPKYEDPYPLTDKHFLAVRQVKGEEMGIVYLDTFGNEVLIHSEAPGCFDPMPVAPRPRPVAIPDRIDLARTTGTFTIYDVYQGTGMERVPRGTVKWVRVVESPEKRFWTRTHWQGSGTQAPGMAWNDFNNKRILGTAPVEPDGSAHFSVPADRFVYFQLLDKRGMMVQSMRSGTIARPGETSGCIGCHEPRLSATPTTPRTAFARPASSLRPWHGEERLYGYLRELQPVLDKHCLRCHDYGGKGAGKVVLAGDLALAFNTSYMELRRRKLVTVPGAGPANVLMPYSWGSHASKVVKVLQKGHHGVKLDTESWDRLVTWIDINAPYYPRYASAYPANLYGRSPLDNGQLKRLSELIGVNLLKQSHQQQLSFTRPEKSPILARLAGAKTEAQYDEALAIVRAGQAALAQRPRADMPGFELLGIEAEREQKYQRLLREEAEARQALAERRSATH